MSPVSATTRASNLTRSGLACAALGFVVVILVTVIPRGPVSSTDCVRPERPNDLIHECVARNAGDLDSLSENVVTFLGGLSLAGGALLLLMAKGIRRRSAAPPPAPAWDSFSPPDELKLGPFEGR
jgi:hypothetical protein